MSVVDGDDVLAGIANSNSFDLSDEGLAAREIDDTDNQELEDAEDESTDDDEAESEDEDAEEVVADPEPEAEAEVDSAAELPEKLRGKSPAEIAAMYLALEQQRGSQSGELGDLRQQTAQQAYQLEQLQQMMQQQQAQQHGGDLVDLVRQNPVGIYNQAMTALDTGQINDPSVIEDIIEEVEAAAEEFAEEGNTEQARQYRKTARSMQRDFDRRLVLAEQQARQAPIQQHVDTTTQRNAYTAGVDAFFNLTGDDGVDAKVYAQDVTNLLKGKDLGRTPEAVQQNLVGALRYVRGMNPGKSAAFVRAQGTAKAAASSQAPSGDKSEKQLSYEEQTRADVFANKNKSPVADMFSSKNFMAGTK